MTNNIKVLESKTVTAFSSEALLKSVMISHLLFSFLADGRAVKKKYRAHKLKKEKEKNKIFPEMFQGYK